MPIRSAKRGPKKKYNPFLNEPKEIESRGKKFYLFAEASPTQTKQAIIIYMGAGYDVITRKGRGKNLLLYKTRARRKK